MKQTNKKTNEQTTKLRNKQKTIWKQTNNNNKTNKQITKQTSKQIWKQTNNNKKTQTNTKTNMMGWSLIKNDLEWWLWMIMEMRERDCKNYANVNPPVLFESPFDLWLAKRTRK